MKDCNEETAAKGVIEAPNSCNASIDTMKDISCSQRLDTSGNDEVSNTNCSGVIQRVELVKDNKPNSTQKRRWGHLYQLSRNFRSGISSTEVDNLSTHTEPMSSVKVQERLFLGRSSSNSLEIQPKDKGIDEISNRVIHRSNKLIESSSNFGKSVGKKTRNDNTGECEGPAGHDALNSTLMASSSGKKSDAEIKPEPSSDQYLSRNIEHSGCISLREWLESRGSTVSKTEKFHLFRKIVELVDLSHHEGLSLQDLRPSNLIFVEPNVIKYIGLFSRNHLQDHGDTDAQMEKNWYSCQHEIDGGDLFSSNVYSLGVIFFELLCPFESLEERSTAMMNLRQLVLPAKLLSESPKEAGFCFRLLHPNSSSRPTTREILDSEVMHCSDDACLINDVPSSRYETDEDTDSDLLRQLLVAMEEQKKTHVSSLVKSIRFLDADIYEVKQKHLNIVPSTNMVVDNDTSDLFPESYNGSDILETRCPSENVHEKCLTKSINELEKAYFSMRSRIHDNGVDRADKDVLSNRDSWCRVQIANKDLNTEGRPKDPGGTFFDGVCMFSRYKQFELCGTMRNGNLLGGRNAVCSLSFDRDEDYIAVAGNYNKIKIFEFGSLLNDSDDIGYSNMEMSNKSKLSCICWNKYFKQYLASTDYDGVVKIWDVSSGEAFVLYNEHQKRTWSVNFSVTDPAKFATGSDDCSVKLWCTTERKSTATIWNPSNICCVQFSAFSSHILAFGSADHNVYCYDIRHVRIPWCTLSGHGKTISHVKFLDSETLVSASTDNTLKLWDLKKTSLEGLSLDACRLTFKGHSNQKNFVGLSVLDGYIACGSETNEVYAYHRSFPVPIASHNFGSVDPFSGADIDDSYGQFVTSVCWREKSSRLVSANSTGRLKVLRLV